MSTPSSNNFTDFSKFIFFTQFVTSLFVISINYALTTNTGVCLNIKIEQYLGMTLIP